MGRDDPSVLQVTVKISITLAKPHNLQTNLKAYLSVESSHLAIVL